jgi:transcriptional regulator of acetoin/glycerol metabolism
VSAAALAELRTYRWPGNVRELRNIIVQAAMCASGKVIDLGHVTRVIAERTGSLGTRLGPDELRKIFEDSGQNVSESARRAGLPRSTMRGLLRTAGVGVS